MFVQSYLLCACSIFVFTETAFVDTIPKCSIKDSECLKNAYEKMLNSISKTGISEYDIPPIGNIPLKDISLSVAGLVDITLVDGTVSGITSCHYKSYSMDIEKEKAKNEIACDSLIVDGKYKLSSLSPIIETFLNGSSIRGEGHGKVAIEKLTIKLNYPFYALKRDGEIYLKCDYGSAKYDFEILGKVKFEADNLYVGDREASKEIVDILNTNWKFIVASVGRAFADKALELYRHYSAKFFDNAPAKFFITDDLTPYARS